MAERSLRGMKIGANSLETDEGVAFVERKRVVYECPNGHQFGVAMAVEAEPPSTWECRCGAKGELIGEAPEDEEAKPAKPVRTHWDMLCERRSLEELEVVLNEQLTLLREGRLRPEGHYRKG